MPDLLHEDEEGKSPKRHSVDLVNRASHQFFQLKLWVLVL